MASLFNDGDIEDHKFVTKAAGDSIALEELYRRHSPSLLAFLRARTDSATAEDIHHDVWIKMQTRPPGDLSEVRGWLFMVARRILIDQYRDPKNREEGLTDDVEGQPGVDLFADNFQKKTNDLRDCLDQLETDFREPLKLWMQAYKHEEIATQLEILEKTSHTRVGRGKAKVKDCMKHKGWTE